MLYHVSPVPGLRTLEPRVSSHGSAYVYAIENPVTALLFGAAKDDFDLMMDEDGAGRPEVWECWPGAFRQVYAGKRCSLYKVDVAGFRRGVTGWDPELVCEEPVPVLEEVPVADLYRALLDRETAGELVFHLWEDALPYRRLISAHAADRMVRFDLLERFAAGEDPRSRYFRPLAQALLEAMDGHLL